MVAVGVASAQKTGDLLTIRKLEICHGKSLDGAVVYTHPREEQLGNADAAGSIARVQLARGVLLQRNTFYTLSAVYDPGVSLRSEKVLHEATAGGVTFRFESVEKASEKARSEMEHSFLYDLYFA